MWCVNLKLRTSGHTANTTPKRSACRDRNLSNLGLKFGELATKFGSGTETRKLSNGKGRSMSPSISHCSRCLQAFPPRLELDLGWFGATWIQYAWIQYVQKCPKIPSFRTAHGASQLPTLSQGYWARGYDLSIEGPDPRRSPKMGDTQWYRTQTNGFVPVSIPISLIDDD